MPRRTIVGWSSSGLIEQWRPTTLDRLNKNEEFLENVLAESPDLLGLQSRRSGIAGPYHVFRQLSMETPSGRAIYPDITLLSASGHVVVCEVKRFVNPELRDRAVIAQIIDYASSFAAMSEIRLAKLFGATGDQTWTDRIQALFADDEAPDELAEVLLERMQSGQLNIVIACDKIPAGLPDVVSGIASQQTLEFDLDLVEVVPFVQEINETADIIFVPSTRLSTEIVSRTAVTVTYREGTEQPSTDVQTTSLESIEEHVKAARQTGNPDARSWTPEEVDEEFERAGQDAEKTLLDFAKTYSADGLYVSPAIKVNPTFGFYVNGRRDDGRPARLMLFYCVLGWDSVTIYLNSACRIVDDQTAAAFRQRLTGLFEGNIDTDLKEPWVPWSALSEHIDDFQELVLWFKKRAGARLSG